MRTLSLPLLPLLLAVGTLTAVTACGGSSEETTSFPTGEGGFSKPPPPGFNEIPMGSSMGRELFLNNAGSSLQKSCGSCHADAKSGAPVFMGPTVEKSYIMLSLAEGMIAAPSDSRLLQQGTHAGPDLAAEQRQLVINWLTGEIAALGLVPRGDGKTLSSSLSEVGACMRASDWTASGLDDIIKLQTKGGQACSDCHSSGEHGVFISVDPAATLEANQQFPIINRWVKGRFAPNRGGFDDVVADNDLASYSKASCDPAVFTCHPAYELPPALVTAMAAFTKKALDRWSIDACSTK